MCLALARLTPMRLLDPRFRYIPAAATDITVTWRRHGFDARWNAERRARLQEQAANADAAIQPLLRKTA